VNTNKNLEFSFTFSHTKKMEVKENQSSTKIFGIFSKEEDDLFLKSNRKGIIVFIKKKLLKTI